MRLWRACCSECACDSYPTHLSAAHHTPPCSLRRFVSTVAGKSAANLRVVLDNNSLVLREVELNLRPPADVRRPTSAPASKSRRTHSRWPSLAA